MRDPELLTPQEWAEELRDSAEATTCESTHFARYLTATDCREVADRMDDLTEALRLLRIYNKQPTASCMEATYALLAKYASEED